MGHQPDATHFSNSQRASGIDDHYTTCEAVHQRGDGEPPNLSEPRFSLGSGVVPGANYHPSIVHGLFQNTEEIRLVMLEGLHVPAADRKKRKLHPLYPASQLQYREPIQPRSFSVNMNVGDGS